MLRDAKNARGKNAGGGFDTARAWLPARPTSASGGASGTKTISDSRAVIPIPHVKLNCPSWLDLFDLKSHVIL